ncbi:hypothetical protein ALP03_200304 [Pseudomonas amygdali pv. tabaci]|uniref:Uncharacterized protein n=1 Tax=Pseudomonas amygdali pv. tabaci TaxID=322 RepID=A0A3M6FLN6_PSEAJ|nr:hypothetical protein ALP03_200304 [Pseudomonas amygdali pv. tabaci]
MALVDVRHRLGDTVQWQGVRLGHGDAVAGQVERFHPQRAAWGAGAHVLANSPRPLLRGKGDVQLVTSRVEQEGLAIAGTAPLVSADLRVRPDNAAQMAVVC